MTPRRLDWDVVQRRLHLMEESLSDLGLLADRTADDLAVDVNSHLVIVAGEPAPETGRESFHAVAKSGVLTPDVAQRLAPSAGLRNLLVHRYGDIRLDLLAAGIAATLDAYPTYIAQVSAYVLAQQTDAP
jgi:uncharacterized protein YutE (UPF0331/DUF86 family)